jgi:hypothetical protein
MFAIFDDTVIVLGETDIIYRHDKPGSPIYEYFLRKSISLFSTRNTVRIGTYPFLWDHEVIATFRLSGK